jgi:Fe-S cluster assembly scaffold protein SufB
MISRWLYLVVLCFWLDIPSINPFTPNAVGRRIAPNRRIEIHDDSGCRTAAAVEHPRRTTTAATIQRRGRGAISSIGSALFVSIGLGPGDDEVATTKDPARKDVLIAGVDYEIPDHELHRQDRRTKLDERCDDWFADLLQPVPKRMMGNDIVNVMQKTLTTLPTLRNEMEIADRNDPYWTPYVNTELPWSILRPAYGLEAFGLPVPRRNAETWRHFDVAGMVQDVINGGLQPTVEAVREDTDFLATLQEKLTKVAGWVPDDNCTARLVFVNGIFIPQVSKTSSTIATAHDTIDAFNEEERQFLSRLTDGWTDQLQAGIPVMYGAPLTSFSKLSAPNHCVGPPDTQFAINSQQGTSCFVALNTLQCQSMAFINVTATSTDDDDKPIIIIHAHTQNGGVRGATTGVAIHPRTVVIAQTGTTATIVQQSVSLDDDIIDAVESVPLLINGYTQMWLKANATISHSYIDESGGMPVMGVEGTDETLRQQENDRPASTNTILETLDVHCAGINSCYKGTIVSVGANARIRFASTISLLQPGASCTLNGFALSGGKCRADIKTNIHHMAAGCKSEQLQKNMVGGRSTTSFRGRIRVERSAQQTDSQQLSRTVLLTDKCTAWTVPSLEIIADDVQCTHGATVSDLSEEELFYLRSRGVDVQSARNLLMFAFCNDVVANIPAQIRGESRNTSVRGGGDDTRKDGLQARVLKRLQNLVPTGQRDVKGEFQSI